MPRGVVRGYAKSGFVRYGDAAYAAPFAARVQASLEAAPWALRDALVEARRSLLR